MSDSASTAVHLADGPQDPGNEHALRIPAVSSRVTCRCTKLTHNSFGLTVGKYDE
jgi:hypothetical protein